MARDCNEPDRREKAPRVSFMLLRDQGTPSIYLAAAQRGMAVGYESDESSIGSWGGYEERQALKKNLPQP